MAVNMRAPERQKEEESGGAWQGAAFVITIAALVALALTTWRYFAPLSGVNGTVGALLAMAGNVALLFGGIALAMLPRGGWRVTFLVLGWIGGLLTLLATVLLHGWSSVAALVALIIALLVATSVKGPARGERT